MFKSYTHKSNSSLTYVLGALHLGQMSERKQSKKLNPHRCRDEIKSDKALEAKRHKIISNVDNLTKAILEEPSMWGRPEFANLRKFVELVSNDRSKFP